MKYFTAAYLQFFKDLAPNNNKEWFDINRKRYEEHVREPFKKFVADLIEVIAEEDTEVQITQKEAIFRINRDIRFSKDKTPYKLNNSAIISKGGRKDKSYPGLYIELGPEKVAIYGGVFMPSTAQVLKIRTHIANNLERFTKLISENEFEDTYGALHGEKAKRIPKEFKELANTFPLILNKQWYYYVHLEPETVERDDFMSIIAKHAKTASALRDFFKDAIA